MPGDPTEEAGAMGNPPSAKLGAVTRKKHEIEELLQDMPANLSLVQTLFAQYKVKVETLKEACSSSHQEWLDENIRSIEVFRARVDGILVKFSTPRGDRFHGGDSTSSHKSHRSFTSSTSSRARMKVAEEKAALLAKRASLEEKSRLQEEKSRLQEERVRTNLQYEREMMKLEKASQLVELHEDETRLNHLENELEKLGITDKSSRKDPLDVLLESKDKDEIQLSDKDQTLRIFASVTSLLCIKYFASDTAHLHIRHFASSH